MSTNMYPQFSHSEMISTIRNGLKKTSHPKNIIIIGAGMAGLVAASLLKTAGHNVKVLEASDLAGGRVYTKRTPFINGQYMEAGAMRIPNFHHLTLEYIKKFNLPINMFSNSTPSDLIYANGIKTRLNIYSQNPINQFDKYSMDTFLRYNPYGVTLSPGAIEMIKVLLSLEGFPGLSFLELLREFMIFTNPNTKYYEITGGNDQLPHSFLPQLKQNIYFNQQVTKIEQDENQVTIHSKHTKSLQSFYLQGDIAIITIPFSILQFIDIEPRESFSHNKWKAIR